MLFLRNRKAYRAVVIFDTILYEVLFPRRYLMLKTVRGTVFDDKFCPEDSFQPLFDCSNYMTYRCTVY